MIWLAILLLPSLMAPDEAPMALADVAADNAPASAVATSACTRVSVHDGDTFRCDGVKIRLNALSGPLDAPELSGSPRCAPGRDGWCDQALAEQARERLKELLRAPGLRIDCDGHDRYGRALCRASASGRDAGDTLVAEGLAKIEERWRR